MTDYKIAPLTWLRTKFAELNHTHSNYVTTSDSRLSDARTPTSHSHGNLQNNGQIGATAQANKNIVTDSSGKITTEDKPTIPTQTSQLTNNSGFITSNSLSNYLQQSDVKDNLTSTDTNKPLSANQGKQLKTLVDGKANSTHSHNDLSQSIQNLGQTISGLADVATSGDYDDLINTPENLSDFNDDVGYLTSHQSLTNYVTTSDSRLSDSRTPIAHATSATTYGVSSASNYGHAMASNTSPKANGTAAVGSETAKFARGDHVHPHNCVNNLTSTSTTTPLAANQGKVLNENKAPTNHASGINTYGLGNSEEYGHVKSINNLTTSSNNDGECLSAYQGKILNDKKLEKTTLNSIDSQYQTYGIYNTWDIYDVFVAQQYISYLNITDTSIDCGGIFQGILKFTNKTSKQMYLELTLTNSNGEGAVYCSFSSNSGNDIDITTTKTSITLQPDAIIYLFIEEENVVIDYAVKSNRSEISVIADMIYPVGSIYMSVNNNNPQILFGGRWEQLKDRFLLGSGDTYANGSTGGSATVSLTVSQMPRHNHSTNAHTHNVSESGEYFVTSEANGANNTRVSYNASGNRYVDGMTSNSTPFHHRAATGSASPTTKYSGGTDTSESASNGSAHENMPPYLTVYMWKRIA